MAVAGRAPMPPADYSFLFLWAMFRGLLYERRGQVCKLPHKSSNRPLSPSDVRSHYVGSDVGGSNFGAAASTFSSTGVGRELLLDSFFL